MTSNAKVEIEGLIHLIDHSGHPSRMMPLMYSELRVELNNMVEKIEQGTATSKDILSLRRYIMRLLHDCYLPVQNPIGQELLKFGSNQKQT